jgi:hypothetical protein
MKKMTHATASHVAEASTDRRRDAVQQLIGEVSVLHQRRFGPSYLPVGNILGEAAGNRIT